jgi:hypothetical protein
VDARRAEGRARGRIDPVMPPQIAGVMKSDVRLALGVGLGGQFPLGDEFLNQFGMVDDG